MFSQPLFIGPLIGLVLGDIPGGLKTGILFQLIYFWVMPIGTATFPEPGIGSVAGCTGYIILTRLFPDRTNLILFLLILFVLLFSLLSGWTLIKQRQFNSKLMPKADLYAEKVHLKGLNYLFLMALGGSFLRGLVITGVGIFFIFILVKPALNILGFIPERFLQDLELPLWGVGIGMMIYLFGRKRNLFWLFLGVVLGIIILLF
jgi:mannose/fructose/N-acetylgalactosamine-specific phosphotransferase system component IIC